MNRALLGAFALAAAAAFAAPPDLRTGAAFHAFDHLNGFAEQAETAAACGATIIYATGLGMDGYTGIPAAETWEAHRAQCRNYNKKAHVAGIQGILGYLCATSIVGLDTFDANWTDDMRAEFGSAPADWLQQDAEGKPLPSWYGGDYRPACMNHPGWRAYQRFMVRSQIETGHDGIFFDNPTVHNKGCYCPHCMEKFAAYLEGKRQPGEDGSLAGLRRAALAQKEDFLRFRCTTARDFLLEMRMAAQLIHPDALVTANNSLNQPDALFAQCHLFAYNIFEMSPAEDFVVIEDMGTQPRRLADGTTLEGGPTYAQLQAVARGRPVVASTIAETDYHTPPSLVRLAMTEAAAHNTGYLLWAAWPEDQRARMAAAVRPCADWLRGHADRLAVSQPRRDVVLFLPFQNWVNTKECRATFLARELRKRNLQFEVAEERGIGSVLAGARVLVVEDAEAVPSRMKDTLRMLAHRGGTLILGDKSDWADRVRAALNPPAVVLEAPDTVRIVLRDTPAETLVFLYNLHIERLSSFEDRVTPAENLRVTVTVPFNAVGAVTASSPDPGAFNGTLPHTAEPTPEGGMRVSFTLPRLDTGALVVVAKG
ncbi:MAG: hypothetical protein GXY15_07130 [Candidatus Hydrogenedentes bacterium]|nr:hypothetical protein [Candidatus Hydrogenedentota bacterium]